MSGSQFSHNQKRQAQPKAKAKAKAAMMGSNEFDLRATPCHQGLQQGQVSIRCAARRQDGRNQEIFPLAFLQARQENPSFAENMMIRAVVPAGELTGDLIPEDVSEFTGGQQSLRCNGRKELSACIMDCECFC